MTKVNNTIAADVFESILAVIYLSNEYNVSKKYIYDIIIPFIEDERTFF